MWEWNIMGADVYHILSWLVIYSFLGWLWETCYVSAKRGVWVNRGFVTGPLCTIYGFGAVSVYLILSPVSGDLPVLFAGGILVPTLLEYITAVLMENIFHTSWWDYSEKRFNFQGRICLGASLGWGVFTVGLFRILHPIVESFTALYSRAAGESVIMVIAVGYLIDFAFSSVTAFRLHERIPAWEQTLDEMQGELLMRVRKTMESLEETSGIARDKVKEQIGDFRALIDLEEKRSALMKGIAKELQVRKEAMAEKLSFNARRFVRAYPNLNKNYRLRRKKNQKKNSVTAEQK